MEILLRISLFVIAVSIGAFCSYRKIVTAKTASKLLWLIFYFGLPLTIAGSILSTPINPDLWYLPVLAAIISIISGSAAFLIAYVLNIPKATAGVLIIGSMIMNTNFTVAFMDAWHGQQGVAVFSLFDIGNIVIFSTIAYAIALKHGGQKINYKDIIIKILKIPLLWVITVSIILSLNGVNAPDAVKPAIKTFSLALFTCVMFTLGLLLHRGIYQPKIVLLGMCLRYGVGALVGWWFVTLLGIEGIARIAIIVGASSPNGYTTLIYARMANLDTKYAASLVSTSLIAGLIIVPLVLSLI